MKISEDSARIASALVLDWSRHLTNYPGAEVSVRNASRPIKSLLVFGDDLSDTGNLFRATNRTVPDPNYFFQGRFSNGPVWPDFIQNVTVLDSVANFAVGGATAMTTNRLDKVGNQGGGFRAQIARFREWSVRNRLEPESTQAIVWLGANDFRQTPAPSEAQVAQAIAEGIDLLVTNFRISKVLIAGLLNPGHGDALYEAKLARVARDLTRKHGDSGVRVRKWDIANSVMYDFLRKGVQSEANQALYCYFGVQWQGTIPKCLPDLLSDVPSAHPECKQLVERTLIDRYPATRTHLLLANILKEYLPFTPQP